MDQRTRKLMTMHKALHPTDAVDICKEKKKEEDLPPKIISKTIHNTKFNKTTKTGRKITVWAFPATNKRNHTRKNLNIVKKGKPTVREKLNLFLYQHKTTP